MEIQKFEFLFIKLGSKCKSTEKFVSETVLSEVISRGSVAVHFSCSLSFMLATSLPAPAEFFLLG